MNRISTVSRMSPQRSSVLLVALLCAACPAPVHVTVDNTNSNTNINTGDRTQKLDEGVTRLLNEELAEEVKDCRLRAESQATQPHVIQGTIPLDFKVRQGSQRFEYAEFSGQDSTIPRVFGECVGAVVASKAVLQSKAPKEQRGRLLVALDCPRGGVACPCLPQDRCSPPYVCVDRVCVTTALAARASDASGTPHDLACKVMYVLTFADPAGAVTQDTKRFFVSKLKYVDKELNSKRKPEPGLEKLRNALGGAIGASAAAEKGDKEGATTLAALAGNEVLKACLDYRWKECEGLSPHDAREVRQSRARLEKCGESLWPGGSPPR
jgi:hypothetical protein